MPTLRYICCILRCYDKNFHKQRIAFSGIRNRKVGFQSVFPRPLLLQSKSLRPLPCGEFTDGDWKTQWRMRKIRILSGAVNGKIYPQIQPQKRKSRPKVRSAENTKNGRPFFCPLGKKTWSRQASLHAPQVRFMAQRAASYGKAVFHKKSLTMKHCFAKAPQYEASPFHSDMKHFAYAPYDVRKWKMRVYPFAISTLLCYINCWKENSHGKIFK